MKRILHLLLSIAIPAAAYAEEAVTEKPDDSKATSILRFAPAATPWAVKACGGATRSGWGRMAVSQGIGAALAVGAVEGLKHSVSESRPDGTDRRSFPSGHAAIAFMGADIATRELGWRSAWYSVGAYGLATAIGTERVISRRHYPTDVLGGAAIGILASELGYLAGDLIFGSRGLDSRYRHHDPSIANDPWLEVKTGIEFTLSPTIATTRGNIHRRPALVTSLGGGMPVADHWAMGLDVSLSSTPLSAKWSAERGVLPALAVTATPTYVEQLGDRAILAASVGGGYRASLPIAGHIPGLKRAHGSAIGRASVGASIAVTRELSFSASAIYSIYHTSLDFDGSRAAKTDNSLTISLSSRINF